METDTNELPDSKCTKPAPDNEMVTKFPTVAWLKRRYKNFTQWDFACLRDSQKGRCRLCHKVKPLVVDYSKTRRDVRGLVCKRCSRLINAAEDAPLRLLGAFSYLLTDKILEGGDAELPAVAALKVLAQVVNIDEEAWRPCIEKMGIELPHYFPAPVVPKWLIEKANAMARVVPPPQTGATGDERGSDIGRGEPPC